MGYALLDQPNPSGPNYYTTRNRPAGAPPILAIVEHITAGLEDLDATDDQSAEGVVRYAQTTDRDVSWHVSTDTDSTIELLPPEYTAWHASNYNSTTYGHEHSKLTTDWRAVPEVWLDRTLRQGARHDAWIATLYGIPVRHATRAELDAEIAKGDAGRPVGFISHAELDPDRRRDPGMVGTTDTFPWARYLDLVRFYQAGGQDDMAVLDRADTNAIWTQECWGTDPATNEVQKWPAVTWLTAMAFRVRDMHAWVAELAGRDPSGIDEAKVAADLAPMLVEALHGQIVTLPDAELGRLAAAVVDEQDRRARDNDPSTGPAS